MIPIRTESPVPVRPVLTGALILLNVAAFLWSRSAGEAAFQQRVFAYGLTPRDLFAEAPVLYLFVDDTPIASVDVDSGDAVPLVPGAEHVLRQLRGVDLGEVDRPFTVRVPRTRELRIGGGRFAMRERPDVVTVTPVRARTSPYAAVFTSMFLHGSWLHLIGNLWFLWLFGPALEAVMGGLRYVGFYLLTGVAAVAAHVIDDPTSTLPVVGASGAISGVMGGFLMLFPHARVLAAMPWFFGLIPLPAFVFLGFYLVEQIVMSLRFTDLSGGVAWWAHIGGFGAGMVLVGFARRKLRRRTRFERSDPWTARRSDTLDDDPRFW
ncbi:MAG TPA: rhomboid family intramembrane serine protease [Planctomycetota bacterium]|nr:rhomboid family intramembrane serine protease [Planctomycetota bacterium]